MTKKLYPLKFNPIPQYRIWGGEQLKTKLNKNFEGKCIGESWELSSIKDNLSLVSNGIFKGKTIKELLLEFKSDLVGEKVWREFGENFPLLIKFINSKEALSVQVHPDDEMAKKYHQTSGKSEMWYIIDAEEDAEIIIDFKEKTKKETYLHHLSQGTLDEILHKIKVKKGDAFYIPAGKIHAIGSGITLAEIQQSSDITYRIYDYNRTDKDGRKRELHTDKALEAIDFSMNQEAKINYSKQKNKFVQIMSSPHFVTHIYQGEEPIKDAICKDSFKVYVCTEGTAEIIFNDEVFLLQKGESLFLPACLNEIKIIPTEFVSFLSASVY